MVNTNILGTNLEMLPKIFYETTTKLLSTPDLPLGLSQRWQCAITLNAALANPENCQSVKSPSNGQRPEGQPLRRIRIKTTKIAMQLNDLHGCF